MVEVKKHPHSGNSAMLQGIIALGLFGTAFYFVFLHRNKAFGQSNQSQKTDSIDNNRVRDYPAYLGRKEFRGLDGNKKKSIYGFPLPNSINDLQFVDNHIRVIVKPNVKDAFGGATPRAMIRLFRKGNKLGYEGQINGIDDVYFEDYESLKDKVVLTKNIFIKNYKLP